MKPILHRLEHEPSYGLHSDERQMRRDAAEAIRELSDALRTMLGQFTKTPSTLRDTEARVKAHAALKSVVGEMA
ncbi:hypothetical protein [Cupriavidus campinensis]